MYTLLMDHLPLPPHLIEALRIIHEGQSVPIAKQDIDKLLTGNWIAVRQPGWALSSKGRELMQKLKPRKLRPPTYAQSLPLYTMDLKD